MTHPHDTLVPRADPRPGARGRRRRTRRAGDRHATTSTTHTADDPATILDLLHENLADYRAIVHRGHRDANCPR